MLTEMNDGDGDENEAIVISNLSYLAIAIFPKNLNGFFPTAGRAVFRRRCSAHYGDDICTGTQLLDPLSMNRTGIRQKNSTTTSPRLSWGQGGSTLLIPSLSSQKTMLSLRPSRQILSQVSDLHFKFLPFFRADRIRRR